MAKKKLHRKPEKEIKTESLSIKFELPLYDALRRKAKEECRSMTSVVRHSLSLYVFKNSTKVQ